MRRLLLLGLLVVHAGCKSATPVVKEKPVADPLYTSKLMSLTGQRGANQPLHLSVPPSSPPGVVPAREGPTQLASGEP